jgi:hypothetical protein
MAVGFRIIEAVASHLSEETGKTSAQIALSMNNRTTRAVRYALTALISDKRAIRDGTKVFALPDMRVNVIDVSTYAFKRINVTLLNLIDDVENRAAVRREIATKGFAYFDGSRIEPAQKPIENAAPVAAELAGA